MCSTQLKMRFQYFFCSTGVKRKLADILFVFVDLSRCKSTEIFDENIMTNYINYSLCKANQHAMMNVQPFLRNALGISEISENTDTNVILLFKTVNVLNSNWIIMLSSCSGLYFDTLLWFAFDLMVFSPKHTFLIRRRFECLALLISMNFGS